MKSVSDNFEDDHFGLFPSSYSDTVGTMLALEQATKVHRGNRGITIHFL
jgi:hypothetical protein